MGSASSVEDHTSRGMAHTTKRKIVEEASEIVFAAIEITTETEQEVHSAMEEARFGSCGKSEIPLGEYGIIDSGATASLGSVNAMQAWRQANVASCGQSRMHREAWILRCMPMILLDKRPTGNLLNGGVQRKDPLD